jgi:hypothetical protein
MDQFRLALLEGSSLSALPLCWVGIAGLFMLGFGLLMLKCLDGYYAKLSI